MHIIDQRNQIFLWESLSRPNLTYLTFGTTLIIKPSLCMVMKLVNSDHYILN